MMIFATLMIGSIVVGFAFYNSQSDRDSYHRMIDKLTKIQKQIYR